MPSTIEAPYVNIGAEPIIAAIDCGGTNTTIQVTRGEKLLGRTQYPTPRSYETAVIVLSLGTKALADTLHIDAVGYAAAGAIKDGRIAAAGQLQEYGWCDMPLTDDVATQMNTSPDSLVLMNDCDAAAYSQMVVNRQTNRSSIGFVETISTGYGGALFIDGVIINKEPGHTYLKDGAVCGCGKTGCAEAHISGSGIERKYGIRAKDLPEEHWKTVMSDIVSTHVNLLNSLEDEGIRPTTVHLFGSVAMKGRGVSGQGVLRSLNDGLTAVAESDLSTLSYLPAIVPATHGDQSGIIGAKYAALDRLASRS